MEEYYYMLVKNTLENYDKEKAIKMIMKRLCDLEEDKTILEKQRENYSKKNYKAKEYIKMYCPMLDNETKPIWNKILKILDEE